jgi:hypothetical protein
MMKIQKVFVCNYCLPVLPCKFTVFGNMPEPTFCPYIGGKCEFEFLNYQE